MSLTRRILLLLLVVVSLYAGAAHAILRLVIQPTFVDLERSEARKDLGRVVRAIEGRIESLSVLCGDWAVWDDSYEFIQDHNAGFIESNLVETSFTDPEINLLYYCDLEGTVVWGRCYDLLEEEYITLSDLPEDALPVDHPLLQVPTVESAVKGLIMTERGPMLVASWPIVTSDREGPVRGAIIFGAILDEARRETLAEQTQVSLQIWPVNSGDIPDQGRAALTLITPEEPTILQEGEERLHVLTTMTDLQGEPIILLRIDLPREISTRGENASRFAVYAVLAAGLVILLVLLILMRKTVIRPLGLLTQHATEIQASDNLTRRLSMDRGDEIGLLARAFDRMVQQLADTRRQLMEQSYRRGRAEMASGVVHNTRNALNPIITRLDALLSQCRNYPLDRIQTAERELAEGKASEERQRDLQQFVELGARQGRDLIREGREGLEDLRARVIVIERLLAGQSTYERQAPPLETVEFEVVLQEALALLSPDLLARADLEIQPTVKELAPFRTSRISLQQVLANLVTNALESIVRAGHDRGQLVISAATTTAGDTEVIHLRIRDNGLGIDESDLKRVFVRGFSSKPAGGTGLGLHWTANTVADLHGTIYAESAGSGQGACLNLLLPLGPSPEADRGATPEQER